MRPPDRGSPAPTACVIHGETIDLVTLATVVCERYCTEFPDEDDRYGGTASEWCCHDNQWLLSWAVADVLEVTSLEEQACWLARVLHSRDFPVDRLARNLQIAAEVVAEGAIGESSAVVAESLNRAAASVAALDLVNS